MLRCCKKGPFVFNFDHINDNPDTLIEKDFDTEYLDGAKDWSYSGSYSSVAISIFDDNVE